MDYAKESLRLHGEWKGKIEVVTRVPVENKDDLSLAWKFKRMLTNLMSSREDGTCAW